MKRLDRTALAGQVQVEQLNIDKVYALLRESTASRVRLCCERHIRDRYNLNNRKFDALIQGPSEFGRMPILDSPGYNPMMMLSEISVQKPMKMLLCLADNDYRAWMCSTTVFRDEAGESDRQIKKLRNMIQFPSESNSLIALAPGFRSEVVRSMRDRLGGHFNETGISQFRAWGDRDRQNIGMFYIPKQITGDRDLLSIITNKTNREWTTNTLKDNLRWD